MTEQNILNVLDVLEVSELLKPRALRTEISLSEEEINNIQLALPSLVIDAEAYRKEAENLEWRRSAALGVNANRLMGLEETFEVRSEKEENKTNKGTKMNLSGADNLLNRFVFISKSALDSAKMSIAARKISLFDLERFSRYVSILSQDLVRKGLDKSDAESKRIKELYSNLTGILDKKCGENSAYIVARRLLNKYSIQGTLEELDGDLIINPITGKATELSIFEKIERSVDPKTGVKYLTAKGTLDFLRSISSIKVTAGSKASSYKGRGNIYVGLESEDRELFKSSLKKVMPERLGNGFLREGTRNLGEVLYALTSDDEIKTNESVQETNNRLLEAFEKSSWKAINDENGGLKRALRYRDAGLSTIAKKLRMESQDLGGNLSDRLFKSYIELLHTYKLYQTIKSEIIGYGVMLGYEDDIGMESRNRKRFPYVNEEGKVANPYASFHPGKLISLITESDLAIMRLDSLPLDYINADTGTGIKINQKVRELKKRYAEISISARRDLEGFLGQDANEAVEKLSEAIKESHLTVDEYGWFRKFKNSVPCPKIKDVLEKTVREALIGICEEDDEVLIKALEILKQNRATAVVATEDRKVQKEINTGDYVITPPSLNTSTPETRFALITGLPLDHELDEAIPDGVQAYYADSGNNENLTKELLLERYIHIGKDDKKAFSNEYMLKEIAHFAEICTEARKELGIEEISKAQKCLINGEEEEKQEFLSSWKDAFQTLQQRWSLAYRDVNDENRTLQNAYLSAGKEYGKTILESLATEILKTANFSNDANSISDEGIDTTPVAKYVCSNLASAVIDATIEKIQKDTTYTEKTASYNTELNNQNDLVKERTDYALLSKSTVPLFLDDVIEDKLLEHIKNPNEIKKLATLTGQEKQEFLNKVIDLVDKQNKEIETKAKAIENLYDPKTNYEAVRDLITGLYAMSALANSETEEYNNQVTKSLVRIMENCPEKSTVCNELLSKITELRFTYGQAKYDLCKECINLIEESKLKYMSPYSVLNHTLEPKHLNDCDAVWAAQKRGEIDSLLSDIREENKISTENRVLLSAEMVGFFSSELRTVRYMKELNLLKGSDTEAYQALEEIHNELKNAVKEDLEKEICTYIKQKGETCWNDTERVSTLPLSKKIREVPDLATQDSSVKLTCPKLIDESESNTKVELNLRSQNNLAQLIYPEQSNEKVSKLFTSLTQEKERDKWIELHHVETVKAIRDKYDKENEFLEIIRNLESENDEVRIKAKNEIRKLFDTQKGGKTR